MGFLELLLLGVGLSMDAFAVSVCKGLKMRRINYKQALVIALFFGGFQALMPFIGWLLGNGFKQYIEAFDHWVAFVLLVFIGGKMIYDSFKADEDETGDSFDIKELFVLAIATSIDALAVGITFSFLSVNIGFAVSVIGCTTFLISLIGVVIGHKFGSVYQKKAELAGGIILVVIGFRILFEHLDIIHFFK